MQVRCEPLYEGDPGPRGDGHCGRVYDDARRWTLCPHNPLDTDPDRGLAAP